MTRAARRRAMRQRNSPGSMALWLPRPGRRVSWRPWAGAQPRRRGGLADRPGPGRTRYRAGWPGGVGRGRGRSAAAPAFQRCPAAADHDLADGRALAGQAGRADVPGHGRLSAARILARVRIGAEPDRPADRYRQAGELPAATDPAAARALDRRGCQAVLRATYVDSTGSLVVTVGVAVLPARPRRARSLPTLPHSGRPGAGVRAVAFGQTLASSFGDRQRQLSWAVSDGPYLIMSVAATRTGDRRCRCLGQLRGAGDDQRR